MSFEGTKKVGTLLTKGESRDKNSSLANALVNRFGLSLAFSYKNESGEYVDAAKLVFKDGHEKTVGRFNNLHWSDMDDATLEHVFQCIRNSRARAHKFNESSSSGGSDLDAL